MLNLRQMARHAAEGFRVCWVDRWTPLHDLPA